MAFVACHVGRLVIVEDEIAAFVPKAGMVPGLTAVGAANGSFSTAACLAEGQAAVASLYALKPADLPVAEDAPYRLQPLWAVPGPGHSAKDRSLILSDTPNGVLWNSIVGDCDADCRAICR